MSSRSLADRSLPSSPDAGPDDLFRKRSADHAYRDLLCSAFRPSCTSPFEAIWRPDTSRTSPACCSMMASTPVAPSLEVMLPLTRRTKSLLFFSLSLSTSFDSFASSSRRITRSILSFFPATILLPTALLLSGATAKGSASARSPPPPPPPEALLPLPFLSPLPQPSP